MRKRKVLAHRCPECSSGQIYFRRFLQTWRCLKCHAEFKEPTGD